MKNNFYTEEELKFLELKKYGKNTLISRKCSIYNPNSISIGDNVRIDDFCILSGNINICNYVHISAYCALYGSMGIEIEDFCGISSRTTIYSAIDDFSGEYMIGPMINKGLTNVVGGRVKLNKYVQVGANCLLFPNIELREGSVIGAMSLVKSNTEEWSIYAGIPVRRIKDRKRNPVLLSRKINE